MAEFLFKQPRHTEKPALSSQVMRLLNVLILVFKHAASPEVLTLAFKYLHVELRAENSNHQLPSKNAAAAG